MSDPRFSSLSSDPRFRLPSRRQARTAVDPRFKTLFTDQEFRKKAHVDRYGRKVKPDAGKKDLERLYRLERGNGDRPKETEEDLQLTVPSSAESEPDTGEEDKEHVHKHDPAREGGFAESESSEEETSDEEDGSDSEIELAEETAGQEQTEEIPIGDVSRRIACVNLDWDNIRAADLMAVAQSFVPSGQRVENVTIYPSEFGKERLEREELEGPPKEVFAAACTLDESNEASGDEDESSDDEEKIKKRILMDQASEGKEFDSAKLRQYQLERLRYYYAVIVCDSASTAKTLYDSMDGREYLSTSNFFDLRFIPDETSFDDDRPHDECNEISSKYKPKEFQTGALTHSKVRLTWDDDDPNRKEVQKRAFSRAEVDENDLKAYIGSDDDRDEAGKEAERQKMRTALGLSTELSKIKRSKDEPVGDMQITFTSGLGSKEAGENGVFENEPQDEESTRARYIRKERERKQKRKEKMKAANKSDDAERDSPATGVESKEDENDPFNDPFFNDPTIAAQQEKAAKKAVRKAKTAARVAAEAEAESRRAELELLMAEDDADNNIKHFDMRELEKARKAAKHKGKGKKSKAAVPVEDDFRIQTDDPRFQNVFESHEFAVDPTNPQFKATEGMKVLQEERRKKRRLEGDGESDVTADKRRMKMGTTHGGAEDVKSLAARIKKKSYRAR